ncbi:MAG: C1 family peptidase [Elusimicrobiales bacterium]|nr:C1 family peptidase [Elusimicrobiales bacterium]
MKKMKRGFIFTAAIMATVIFFNTNGFSQKEYAGDVKETVVQIQALIDASGAKWTAGKTILSDKSWAEWQNYVGLSFEPITAPPLGDEEFSVEPPPSLDWRKAGGNYVTNIRNQGKCGSCWAFAMTGGLESYVLLSQNTPGIDLDLSEQVMLSCSGTGSCNGGRLNASYLENTGLPPEEFYPYTATDGNCSSAEEGWQSKAYKISNWKTIYRSEISLKKALVEYGPMPTALMVYEDFMHYKSGIYSHVTGNKLGGHAVVVIGYNDAEKYFIVKNSWSEKWGDEGYFKIAYSEIKYPIYFGMSTIAYTDKDGEGVIPTPNKNNKENKSINTEETWIRTMPMFKPLLDW